MTSDKKVETRNCSQSRRYDHRPVQKFLAVWSDDALITQCPNNKRFTTEPVLDEGTTLELGVTINSNQIYRLAKHFTPVPVVADIGSAVKTSG